MTHTRQVNPQCAAAERPRLYDLAYDVFDVTSECDEMLAFARRYGTDKIGSILDVGCGTGHHARNLATRGFRVVAFDNDNHMIRYSRELARQAGLGRSAIVFRRADMRAFELASESNLAICLGASFNSLLTEQDATSVFECVGRALKMGGVFVLELHDPPTAYGEDLTAQWTVRRADATVRGQFSMTPQGRGDSVFQWDISVDARYQDGRAGEWTRFRTLARPWTRGQIAKVAESSRILSLVGWHRIVELGQSPRILAVLTRNTAGRGKALSRRTR